MAFKALCGITPLGPAHSSTAFVSAPAQLVPGGAVARYVAAAVAAAAVAAHAAAAVAQVKRDLDWCIQLQRLCPLLLRALNKSLPTTP